MTTEQSKTILLADRDDQFRGRLRQALEERGFRVREASGVDEALSLAAEESPEYALVDLDMPDNGGLQTVRGLREIDPAVNTVVLTGYGRIALALEAVRMGATHYLIMPTDVEQILEAFSYKTLPLANALGDNQEELTPEARAEWAQIQRVLVYCGGNLNLAARLLGVHRRVLQRKLAELGRRF